jgi:putative addiction module component (TIGR02574 family)
VDCAFAEKIMTQAFKSALDVALTLSESERAEFAEILMASITETSRSEIDESWVAEAERRDRAMNDGTEELLDGNEILGKLARTVDRARIAEKLLQSLSGSAQAEIDAVWTAEAERRLQAYREGQIESFSADEVFGSLL